MAYDSSGVVQIVDCRTAAVRGMPNEATNGLPVNLAGCNEGMPSNGAKDEQWQAVEVLERAFAAIGRRADCYAWAADGRYVTREHLLENFSSTIVVDTRDDDVIGGMICGALHMADSTFGPAHVLRLLEVAEKSQARSVVFHCMESARRGPRCAKRMVDGMMALQESGHHVPEVDVRVLEGGFDQWVRRYWKDPQKVVGYDDEYWGFELMGGTQLIGNDDENDGHANDSPMHPLYDRPNDQPATPWSKAGCGLNGNRTS